MKTQLLCSGMLLFFGSSLLAQESIFGDSKEHRDGYKQGAAEAEKELKEGHPTLYLCGYQRGLLEHLDKETGLPYRVIAGCVVDDQVLGREQGHDATIREHIKAHGLPASSFKKWEKELFDLKAYYINRTKTEQAIPLDVGGPKRVSGDCKFTITPVQTLFKKDDGTISPRLGIALAAPGKKPVTQSIFGAEDKTDFLWGPPESQFIVIRAKGERMDFYMALDLERAMWLRWDVELKARP